MVRRNGLWHVVKCSTCGQKGHHTRNTVAGGGRARYARRNTPSAQYGQTSTGRRNTNMGHGQTVRTAGRDRSERTHDTHTWGTAVGRKTTQEQKCVDYIQARVSAT